MKYICSKRMKTKTISGEVNFPVGTVFNCVDGLITHNGKAICYDHSQNAYDYLSCDDDGFGIRRGQLVRDIMGRLKKRDDDYQARWDRIWMDKSLQKYKRTEFLDFWLWNYDFFNAPIGELEYILARVKGEVEPRDGIAEDFMDEETEVEDGEA